MNDKSTFTGLFRRVPLTAGVARIIIVVGGTFKCLTKYVAAAAADLLLYVDVQSELTSGRRHKGVRLLPLAAGQTLNTLLGNGGPKALRELCASRPGINLELGLGQLPAIGKVAAQKLLDDPAFAHFIEQHVFEPLFILHNGGIERVEITVCTSGSGGTGSASGPMIASAIKDFFIERLEPVVDLHFLRAGSLSFVGLGPRLHVNNAGTIEEDVRYMTSVERNPLEIRRLTLFEGPMVRDNRGARDAFMAQLTQGLRAVAVREELDRRAPNAALDSALGTINVLGVSCHRELPPRRIAAEMARAYLPRLERLGKTGSKPHRLHSVEVILKPEPTPRFVRAPELSELICRRGKAMPPELVELCVQAPEQYLEGTVVVVMDHDKFNLTADFRAYCRNPASTESEFADKLERLCTISEAIETELTSRRAKLFRHQKKLAKLRRTLEWRLRFIYPSNWWEHLLASLGNPQKRLLNFLNLVARCREEARACARLEAEMAMLGQTKAKTDEEIAQEKRRLGDVINFLKVHRPVEGFTVGDNYVEVKPLDEVLPGLLEATLIPSDDALLEIVAAGVERITLAGLAEITRASACNGAAIAAALLYTDPATDAPAWGGKVPMAKGRILIVLPPVAEEVEVGIRDAIAARDGHTVVLSADTAEAGANILRLEIREPKFEHEILTPFYRRNLKSNAESGLQSNGAEEPKAAAVEA